MRGSINFRHNSVIQFQRQSILISIDCQRSRRLWLARMAQFHHFCWEGEFTETNVQIDAPAFLIVRDVSHASGVLAIVGTQDPVIYQVKAGGNPANGVDHGSLESRSLRSLLLEAPLLRIYEEMIDHDMETIRRRRKTCVCPPSETNLSKQSYKFRQQE